MHLIGAGTGREARRVSGDGSEFPVVDDVVVARLLTLRDQVARPGEDVLGELLTLFERDSVVRIAAIRAALAAGDVEERRNAAHALKGSAGNVGARRVAALAARIEGNVAADADADRLESEVAAALVALKARLE